LEVSENMCKGASLAAGKEDQKSRTPHGSHWASQEYPRWLPSGHEKRCWDHSSAKSGQILGNWTTLEIGDQMGAFFINTLSSQSIISIGQIFAIANT